MNKDRYIINPIIKEVSHHERGIVEWEVFDTKVAQGIVYTYGKEQAQLVARALNSFDGRQQFRLVS